MSATQKPLPRVLVGLPWFCGFLGIGCIGYLTFFDAGSSSQGLAIFSIFAIQAVTLALHEGAHLAVAAAFGLFPITVELGVGDTALELKGDRVSLILRCWPMGGMVIPSHPRRGFLAPWQSALLSLAGPGIDLLVFIVVVWLLASPPDVWRDLPAGGQLELILGVTAGYLVYSHLREFWPRKVQTHRGETYNDMGAVWELAKLKWKNPGLQALIRTLKDCIESRDTTALRRVHSAYEAAIQSCRDPAARDYLNDCLCTTVLLHDLPGLLDLADRASSDLFRAQPDQLTYRGTRGGVLAERGDAQCVALLEHVVDQSSAVHDRSISAAFLSIFYLRSHQLDLARDWLEKARSFNPECLAVQRAAAEMSQAKGDQSS